MALAEKFWIEQLSVNILSYVWSMLKNFIEKLLTLVWSVFSDGSTFFDQRWNYVKKLEPSLKVKRAKEKLSDNHQHNISDVTVQRFTKVLTY